MDWFNMVDAVYRSDLRDLNELNFARFDSKLEQSCSPRVKPTLAAWEPDGRPLAADIEVLEEIRRLRG